MKRMQYDPKINKIIEKGFDSLPVDPERAETAADKILGNNQEEERNSVGFFSFFNSEIIYAAAALFVLMFGSGLILLHLRERVDTGGGISEVEREERG
ncbi:MAG: hypothetical protein ACOCSE_04145, partial [Chitinivibrionales bacterium]